LENNKAIKLIDKILKNLDKTGINSDVLVEDIKALRAYALEAQVPLVVKVLRLTYEHIEATESFMIPMLDLFFVVTRNNKNELNTKKP